MKKKSFLAIRNAPEPTRSILGGIAAELMDIDPLLRITPLSASDSARYGFNLCRRKAVLLTVVLNNHVAVASYSYRTRQHHNFGSLVTNIQDPDRFESWKRDCEKHVLSRIIYIVNEQIDRQLPRLERLRCVVSLQNYKAARAIRDRNRAREQRHNQRATEEKGS
jgi:hypothetical protein